MAVRRVLDPQPRNIDPGGSGGGADFRRRPDQNRRDETGFRRLRRTLERGFVARMRDRGGKRRARRPRKTSCRSSRTSGSAIAARDIFSTGACTVAVPRKTSLPS
jgi:hypothetical protein